MAEKNPLPEILVKWLEQLEERDTNDPLWDSLPRFLDCATELRETKLAAAGQTRLAEVSKQLWEDHSEDLQYFEFDLSSPPVVPDQTRHYSLIEQLEKLPERIASYNEALTTKPTDLGHANELRQLAANTEAEIAEIRLDLRKASEDHDEESQESPKTEEQVMDVEDVPSEDAVAEVEEDSTKAAKTSEGSGLTEPSPSYDEVPHVEDQERVGDGDPTQVTIPSQPAKQGDIVSWMVQQNDLAGAYWMTRHEFSATDTDPTFADWLIQAVMAASWVEPGSPRFTEELLRICREQHLGDDPVSRIMALAASIRSVLIVPGTDLQGWLQTPPEIPEITPVTNAITKFLGIGKVLLPNDLADNAGLERTGAEIAHVSAQARNWLEEAPMRHTRFARATKVWRKLIEPGGALYELLNIASQDRRPEAKHLSAELRTWENREHVVNTITSIDMEIRKKKAKPITGTALDQLIRYSAEGCALASLWTTLVADKEQFGEKPDFVSQQLSALKESIDKFLSPAIVALDQHDVDAAPQVSAAHSCLRRELHKLGDLLIPKADWSPEDTWDWLGDGVEDLRGALSRRVMMLPQVELDDSGEPEDLASLGQAFRQSIEDDLSVENSIRGRIHLGDLRFVSEVLRGVEPDAKRNELEEIARTQLEASRVALESEIEETRTIVEQGVVDGIVGAERSDHLAVVESLAVEKVKNFAQHNDRLRAIRGGVLESRKERLKELEKEWERLGKQVGKSLDHDLPANVTTTMDRGLSNGDVRVVEECQAAIRDYVESGRDLNAQLFESGNEEDPLEAFLGNLPGIEQFLEKSGGIRRIEEAIKKKTTSAGIKYGEIADPRLQESTTAVASWRKLKQVKPNYRKDVETTLRNIVRFLGYSLDQAADPAIRIRKKDTHWLYAQIHMSASNLARPIPQYGSQANGVYDVVCLWERPGAETITSWLRGLNLEAKSLIVLYLGRLGQKQRLNLGQRARARELTIAVLDESLLVHLTSCVDTRLPVFLRCSLPYTTLNPYAPFRAGDVPSEVFFGRASMLRELQESSGSCIVFGGRQLGKSALLNRAAADFQDPSREQYAWVEDIKLLGDPEAGIATQLIWDKLRKGLKQQGLISAKVRTNKPDDLRKHIVSSLEAVPDRRLVVFFDEADNFLNADSQEGFAIIEQFRQMMQETGRRLKVVFAGLHNVQRFQGIPNQPLAHFGDPINVGPLEPSAALSLVKDPMEFVGFRFDDRATILRILSYTNYHPGLIQLFCQRLLQRLNQGATRSTPPFLIERGTVESVYQFCRDSIRERLDWTLALDQRYQCIAWTLIYHQAEERDSYARPFSAGEVLELVSYSWEQGFIDVSEQELRGLLDEMSGLGTLTRTSEGKYRLRSPNLVRLMGTPEDIEARLAELENAAPGRKFDADSYHSVLLGEGLSYSPMTNAQERTIYSGEFGAGLILQSEALGGTRVADALETFSQGADSETKCVWVTSPLDVRQMASLVVDADARKCFILVRDGNDSCPAPDDLRAADEEARRLSDSRKQTRVIFSLEVGATWDWISQPWDEREEIENRLGAVVVLTKWNPTGIRQRLKQSELIYNDDVCSRVAEATGGWPLLLDNLLDYCGDVDHPGDAIGWLETQLQERDSQLCKRFLGAVGHTVCPTVERAFRLIKNEGPVPTEMLTEPDVLGIELSPQECRASIEFLRRIGAIRLAVDQIEVDPILASLSAS